jgi:phosphoglycolate phosphatase
MINIFFDLDGTIWDASESTAIAWTKVFKKWKINCIIFEKDIQSVAGKPYIECLDILAPEVLLHKEMDKILIELAIEEKKMMKEIGGKYYENALATIEKISKEHQLFLVSNCNDWYLKAFLNNSGINNAFKESICFGTFNQNKVANLRYLLNKFNISEGYYIGDTKGDMKAAQEVGLTYIHMKHGFDSLLKNDIILENFSEMAIFFNKINRI